MSESHNIEEAAVPQLHSFQTSQPTNEIDTPLQESAETSKTETVKAPKDKSRKGSATNDVNVIDIGDEEEGEESSGTSVLPLTKIKKIFKTDPEHVSASEAAVFSTAIATELFIQYFTEQASLIARSEKRKKLQYKDFSSAVTNIEQLNFLSDTVPKTVNLKKLVDQNKVNYSSSKQQQPLSKGQQTLNLGQTGQKKTTHTEDDDLPESDPEELSDNNNDDGEGEGVGERSIEDENNNTEDEDEDNVANITSRPIDRDRDVIMEE